MYFERKLAWIAYGIVWLLAWPVLYFYYFCRSRTDGKYLANYRARLGLNLPGPFRKGTGRIWFHALSVGEVLSSIPLVVEVSRQKPAFEIVFSTATETGMVLAKERLSDIAGTFFFMPHDFPWTMQKLAGLVLPDIFVLIETDAWPNLLHQLRKEGVFTVLANGRMSPDSYRGYSRIARFAGMIFNGFDLIFAQSDLDRARFESLGDLSGRVSAAGNLKFESSGTRASESHIDLLRNEIGLDRDRPVWIAGSTHEGEEAIVVRVHERLRQVIPNLLLMIAPRRPTRRNELLELCALQDLTVGVRSKGDAVSGKAVYVIDTLGELAGIYALSDIAFIGGSLAPLGGHNPLEALVQGKPVCWGPHFFNFHEIEAALLGAGCARKVSSEEELGAVVQRFFEDERVRAEMVEAVENFAGLQRGTAERIASALLGAVQHTSNS